MHKGALKPVDGHALYIRSIFLRIFKPLYPNRGKNCSHVCSINSKCESISPNLFTVHVVLTPAHTEIAPKKLKLRVSHVNMSFKYIS